MRTMPARPRRRSCLLLLAVSATALAGSGAAAQAAQAKAFDLSTGTAITPGKAHGYGNVTFLGPRRAKITGKINDICPKDGYGAYIEFKMNFAGGGYARTVRQDTAKCGGAAKAYSFTTPSFKKHVVSVGVTVIELDNNNGVLTPGDAARVLLRNPR